MSEIWGLILSGTFVMKGEGVNYCTMALSGFILKNLLCMPNRLLYQWGKIKNY